MYNNSVAVNLLLGSLLKIRGRFSFHILGASSGKVGIGKDSSQINFRYSRAVSALKGS